MSPTVKTFFQRWIVTTLGVLAAANIVQGIHYDTAAGLLLASLLLGILNASVRPIMIVLSLPLLIFTLGLFIVVINALLLYFVGWLLKSFHVDNFSAALFGGVVISLISMLANWLLGTSDTRVHVRRGPPRSRPPSDGGGPVIDV